MSAFARTLERIGENLDAAICSPGPDELFVAGAKRIVVAISDTRWKSGFVMLTAYDEQEVRPVSLGAKAALDAALVEGRNAGAPIKERHVVNVAWAEWSRRVSKQRRESTQPLQDAPDTPVGLLFICCAPIRERIDEIVRAGDTPVLAVALNSAGLSRRSVGCSLRAVVFPVPAWAQKSGRVAGSA
jgi:hypothetical protein